MTKRERIAALERKVADLEARIAAAEARPYVWPYSIPAQPLPFQPTWIGDAPVRITTTDGTGAEPCGIGWRTQ